MISFYNGATAEEWAKAAPSPSPSPAASPKPEEHESDVRVITRAVYRSNGAGYVDNKHPQHIWVVTAPRTGEDKVTPKQLTNGHYDDGNVVWAKDNSQLYFVSNHSDEPYYALPRTDIYTIQSPVEHPASWPHSIWAQALLHSVLTERSSPFARRPTNLCSLTPNLIYGSWMLLRMHSRRT